MRKPMGTDWIYPQVRGRVVARRGRAHIFDVMNAASTAIVVIDLQMHFMSPGFPGELPTARDIVPAVNALVDRGRDLGATIIWVTTAAVRTRTIWPLYATQLLTEAQTSTREASLEGEGAPLWTDLHVAAADHLVQKTMFSAFAPDSSDLPVLLGRLGCDTLVIAGAATNTCCDSTARDAAMRNFRTTMVGDALAARSDDEHTAALSNFYGSFGDVQTVDQVIAALQRGRSAPVGRP